MDTLLTVTALVTDSGTNRRAISLCVLEITPTDSGVGTDLGRLDVTAPAFNRARRRWFGPDWQGESGAGSPS